MQKFSSVANDNACTIREETAAWHSRKVGAVVL